MSRLIAYVGRGLGSSPETILQGGARHVVWNTTDKRVRLLPDEDAASLLRTSPANFKPAVLASDVTASEAQIAEVIAAGHAHTETFNKRGQAPAAVYVIDDPAAGKVLIAAEPDKPKKKGGK